MALISERDRAYLTDHLARELTADVTAHFFTVPAPAVSGVPRTVVNDTHSFVGALPEARFVAEVRRAATAQITTTEPPVVAVGTVEPRPGGTHGR
jgi:hypothetical protein